MKTYSVSKVDSVKPSRTRRGGGRTGGLNSSLSVSDINNALGFRAQHRNGDKSTRCWSFVFDNNVCEIWDYKGYRWSTGGPHHVFKSIFGDKYTADRYPGKLDIEVIAH